MKPLINWIKSNKLSAFLLVLLVAFLYMDIVITPAAQKTTGIVGPETLESRESGLSLDRSSTFLPPTGGATPRPDIADRMVSVTSSLSLVVLDVRDVITNINGYAQSVGGYMVNSSQDTPEGLSTGTITIRVPSEQLDPTLAFLRNQAVKVVSENVYGTDITDEYVDIEERLTTLETTKERYEGILASATDVNDILNVTQQILYIQDQIDSFTGRLEYLEASANTSLITVYLSTDELALPYTPDQSWRPEVIFKLAVRSLVSSLQDLGSFVIWILVYAPVWGAGLLIYLIWKRKIAKKSRG